MVHKPSSVDLAYEILQENRRPMSATDIMQIAIQERGLVMRGRTPDSTLAANFINEAKRRARTGRRQRFVRTSPGKWGLCEYVGEYYEVKSGTKQPY